MTEQEIFAAAIKLTGDQRAAFLKAACNENDELLRGVEALLSAHDETGGFLGQGAAREQERTELMAAEVELGSMVAGRYKLVEPIGEGGMGTVWLAEQKEPVKRKVAVKMVKPGMDSRVVLARFEAERQALAMMDHPNIAKVLDGGITEQGRPYFAMELVRGIPVTDYCDQTQLSIRKRLEVFGQICSAVQHAHQKGIIHRDLKPSNILITEHDGQPVAKVIDFGLAKALHGAHALTDISMHTSFGSVLGTPLYMAPEQLGTSALDVDTRADLYSLGVILYEMLTGSTPIERERIKEAAWDEILRILREEEPQSPSTRLSSSGSLPSLAARRHVEPARLTRLVRGELDWIIMKALEKNRNRRYETAGSLGQDVRRYLDGAPVEAAPPSRVYRLRKLVRRHRGPVLAASLVFLTLLAGLAGTLYGLRQANQSAVKAADAQKVAEQKQKLAEKQRKRAEAGENLAGERLAEVEREKAKAVAATEQAEKRLAQIEKGNEIITSIFADLDIRQVKEGTEPLEAVLAKRLVKAADQLFGESVGDLLAVAKLQLRLGGSLLSLGFPDDAIKLFDRARATISAQLGEDHPITLTSMDNLAQAYQTAGKLDLALPLFKETLKLSKVNLGDEHPDTLISMNNLAHAYLDAGKPDMALPLFEESLKLSKVLRGDDHRGTISIMDNLARAYQAAGKLDLALPLFKETLKLSKVKRGDEHPGTLITMSNLALAYQAAGKLDLALPLFIETLKIRKVKLGDEHPDTLAGMNNLAQAYLGAGKLDLALPLQEEALKLSTTKQGDDHPTTLFCMSNLAAAYLAAGKLDLALPLFKETLKLRKLKLGDEHPDTLCSMSNLAQAFTDAKRLDLALPLHKETLKLSKVKLGDDHPSTLVCMNNLATAYHAAGKLDLGLPLFEENLKLSKVIHGDDHPRTLSYMNSLAGAYHAVGKLDLAMPLLEEAIKLSKLRLGDDHPRTLSYMNSLAGAYQAAGKLDLALPLFEETIKLSKVKLGDDHPATLARINNLAGAYYVAGKLVQALPLLEESLELSKVRLGNDHPTTLDAMNKLGTAYWFAGKLDKSVPLFEELVQLYETKFGRDHHQALLSIANLGVNYKDSGRVEKALPLLEEAYATSKKHPSLQTIGWQLVDAYLLTGRVIEIKKAVTIFAEVRQTVPPDSPQLAGKLAKFGLGLLAAKAYEQAEPILRECVAIREKIMPDHWLLFNTHSMLGGALLGQEKYAEAEPLLIAGYEGLVQHEATIPADGKIRVTETLERLIELYSSLEKPDGVKKWQAKLDRHMAKKPPHEPSSKDASLPVNNQSDDQAEPDDGK